MPPNSTRKIAFGKWVHSPPSNVTDFPLVPYNKNDKLTTALALESMNVFPYCASGTIRPEAAPRVKFRRVDQRLGTDPLYILEDVKPVEHDNSQVFGTKLLRWDVKGEVAELVPAEMNSG